MAVERDLIDGRRAGFDGERTSGYNAQTMSSSTPNRWTIASAAVAMQVCLGIFYSWSVFRGPLAATYHWSMKETIAPYRWSIACFTIAMIIAGFWQDRKGPRIVGSAGGVLLGLGCLLASFLGDTLMGLNLSYGVVAGFGVGFAYVTPIATCIKWFPDRRGFVVGLAVMGFGAGSLIFAPLLEALIGKDPSQYAQTLPRTFLILSGIFLVIVTGCAQFYQVPPSGWKPAGWDPPAAAAGSRRVDYQSGDMLRTPQFYVLWLLYFLGSAVGLTVIGEASPMIKSLSGASAVMTGGSALGIMSIFNGLGRLGWGTASDKIGRKQALFAMCAIFVVTCALLLPNASGNFWLVLAGVCFVGLCYGGFLALMPSLTADYYGPRYVGANYGLLFTAWGAAGFVVPLISASILDEARAANRLTEGYTTLFYTLTALAAAGLVMTLLSRRPSQSV